jgi:WD40 repeat protein
MLIKLSDIVLVGLLPLAYSRSLPSKTKIEKARAAAAPAIPTSTLVSDFKKNNVSSQWAEGHPKVWGSEDVKFEFPTPPSDYYFSGKLSPDEKFIVMANISSVKIVDLNTKALLSTFKLKYNGEVNQIEMLPAPGGGYDLLISSLNYTARDDTITRVQISVDGTPKGEQILYPGRFSSFDKTPFSSDGRRILASNMPSNRATDSITIAYDLDKPGSNVTMAGHGDWVMSSAFSPDGKYISTASWDGYAKVWNSTTGEVLHTFGPTGGQNWLTNFSPDGKYVLMTSAGTGGPAVNLWPVANFSAEPIVIKEFRDWIRTAAWTSDSELLAVGEYGLIYVYSMKEQKIVQKWVMEDRSNYETWELAWIESNSGRKLTYRTTGGLEVYDFETNLKYRWGPDDFDRYNGASGDSTMVIKSKGLIGGVDPDSTIRLYKFQV